MELPSGRTTQARKDFWIQHIEAAEKFEGTLKEYCIRHGLKAGSMNAYRKKLGYSKPRSKTSKPYQRRDFIPVNVGDMPSPPLSMSSSNFPDPNWLAQFLKAWVSQ